MSSILKALKKLEDDKAALRPDELNIDAEILRSDNSSRFSSAGLLLASLLLMAGGSVATYMYMKQDKVPGQQAKLESTVMSGQNKPLAPSVSEVKTEQLPAAILIVPAKQHKTSDSETPGQPQPKLHARVVPAATPPKTVKSVLPSKSPDQTILPKLTASRLSAPQDRTVPALRVNGIAFMDGGGESVAMINDSPAMNGSEIDGVKVEEIHKNRVKFSYNGEKFEILLGQSNR